MVGADNDDADAGAFGDGFDDVGCGHHVAGEGLGAGDEEGVGDGDAGGLHGVFGAFLVHGQRGGQHTGVGVGDLQRFEDALHAAVFAVFAMKRIEAGVGLEGCEHGCDVAADVDFGDGVAFRFEGLRHGGSGAEGHVTLGGQATFEDGDVVVFAGGHVGVRPRRSDYFSRDGRRCPDRGG